jgi:hypothetical protein
MIFAFQGDAAQRVLGHIKRSDLDNNNCETPDGKRAVCQSSFRP